jgi:hypothetical protein
MTCSGDIRAHIDALSEDEIVTTRDLLEYGYRNTVDKTLSRLVDIKVLVRIARGVFIKPTGQMPPPLKVAIAKAKAFGKELVTHGQELAREFQLTNSDKELQFVYQVKGRTSSFLFLGQRIYMRGVVAKKMFGGESKIGKVLRALCFLGRRINRTQLLSAISHVDPTERHLLLKASRWVPSYLSDEIRKTSHFRQKSKPVIRAIAS